MFHITNANDFYNNCLDIYINNELLLEKTIIDDNYESLGLIVKYNNGSINNLNFTLFENNKKWNELSIGFIKTNVYSNKLKLDINLNKIIFIDYIYILENHLKTILSKNKCFSKYKIIIKKTIIEKDDKYYFNNIKFNYFKKKETIDLITKVYIKKVINGNVESILLSNDELNNYYINKGFYISPVISLTSLFVKKEKEHLFIYPQYFLNNITLYTKYKEKHIYVDDYNISEEGYV
jgi:hypothetical protein